MFPKSRNVTKIDHTVWPPPINGNKKRKDSAFLSGRVQVLLWCRLCQTAAIIIWSLGKRKKRPKAKPTAAAATPNEPKGAKRTRRRHSVQHHHTPTQSLGACKLTIFRSHYPPARPLFRAFSLETEANPEKPPNSRNQSNSCKFHEFAEFLRFLMRRRGIVDEL